MGVTTVGSNDAYPKSNEGAEIQRLDDQHQAMVEYSDGKITFAPLKNPQRILEVGAGSGAWAILAAKQYPQAEVVAIDMAPFPDRPVPPNLKFQQLNLMDPLPFEPESFDVLHSRFVLQHLPMPNDVLERLNQLVKPSGWLLFEDTDAPIASSEHARAIVETISRNRDFRLSKGLSINAASDLEPRVHALGSYDKVNVHKVLVPVNIPDPVKDEKIARLAQQFRVSMYRFIADPVNEHAQKGWLTPQLQLAFKDEFDTLPWTITLSVFWVWAQKRA